MPICEPNRYEPAGSQAYVHVSLAGNNLVATLKICILMKTCVGRKTCSLMEANVNSYPGMINWFKEKFLTFSQNCKRIYGSDRKNKYFIIVRCGQKSDFAQQNNFAFSGKTIYTKYWFFFVFLFGLKIVVGPNFGLANAVIGIISK